MLPTLSLVATLAWAALQGSGGAWNPQLSGQLPPGGIFGVPSAPTPLTTQLVVTGLTTPVALTAPPMDLDRLFVVEQYAGSIRIVKGGALLPTPFLSLASQIALSSEQGLLGLAFHPLYAQNGAFFVTYTEKQNGDFVLARYRVSSGNPDLADPASATILLQVPHAFSNHNGGMLQFGTDGCLYVSTGDGGSAYDPGNNAQNLGSLLGKILRIDVDTGNPYGIPPGNPFVGVTGARPEIWLYGLRNPWKFSLDHLTGDLYLGDVGQDQWEEIDFLPGGGPGGFDLGWRCWEGTSATGMPGCTGAPALAPIHEYAHGVLGCAAVGGMVYRGYGIPDLRGQYFYTDWCKPKIFSFKVVQGAVTDLKERTLELTPNDGVSSISTVSSFGEDGAGELYILDYAGGEVFKILPAQPVPTFGVFSFGTGTPGCAGVSDLTVLSSPIVGNPFFGFRCSNVPASSTGFLFVTDVAYPAGGDALNIGAISYLDFSLSTETLTFLMPSNASGNAILQVAIPLNPLVIGRAYTAQSFWYWAGQCMPAPSDVSSSTAIEMIVLP